MTKADIVQALYTRVGGFSKQECADLVDLVFETMKELLGRGEQLKLSGFGKFVLRDKETRRGRNPQTGVPITIAGRRVVSFKPSPVLKEMLNGVGIRPSVLPLEHGREERTPRCGQRARSE
jgi:integration host factor subunit alpha